ncbi:hypothetical protein [Bacillus alveayuensis]|uniref:hypothetical protein n=1 Tax=Aeribacillus alveayuensis TaxID=279215 RepID=UPI0005CCE090|nr:hypothetical protein [Bacillus alveayuensis]
MKKRLIILSTILFILAGCTIKKDSPQVQEKVNEEETKEEELLKNEKNELKNETNGEKESKPEEKKEEGIFNQFKPEVGIKKVFIDDNSDIVMTEEIIAEKDDYIQILLTIGASNTTQIYKWTGDEITLVFEKINPDSPRKNILNEFKPNKDETILSNRQQTDWELIEKDTTVAVPYGEFENVYVVKKVTGEVVNEDTIYTRYYAPGVGLVKENFELTGENGYKGELSLSKVEK